MNKQIIDRVVISGARGFVGKNLKKFLLKNKISSIPISRQNFKKNQFPSLKNVSHFVNCFQKPLSNFCKILSLERCKGF